MSQITNPKRILLKVSWETFKNESSDIFDYKFMEELAKKIIFLTQEKKMEIVLVSWWWNIFRGAQHSKWAIDIATWHYIWMMATLMNGMAFADILQRLWQETRVLSTFEIPRIAPTFNRNEALRHLKKWRIIIATAGTGNPYCTNDLAAIIRAIELNCNLVVKATKVDGIYDKDPMKYPDAKKFDEITHEEAFQRWLKIMDHSAIATAMDNKMPIFVCRVEEIEKIWTPQANGSRVY